jgi:hypothetical protein
VGNRIKGGFKSQRYKVVVNILEHYLINVLGTLEDVRRKLVVVGTKRAEISYCPLICTYKLFVSTVLQDAGICRASASALVARA